MARAVIVNGAARSGKDTFCQLCQDASYFHDALTIQISSGPHQSGRGKTRMDRGEGRKVQKVSV